MTISPVDVPIMSDHQPVQQARHDPEIIYITNSPIFKAWYQHHSQYFCFESVYEAAVIFILKGLPDVVSQLTGAMWDYPQGTLVERWGAVKSQLYH